MQTKPSPKLLRLLPPLMLLLSFSGCAPPSPPAVALATLDSHCPALTASRQSLTWEVQDTAPTINGIRRMRAMIAKLCPPAGKKVA